MKQHLFLDTNILLDFIVGVPDLYNNAAKIISLADIGSVKITISVISYAATFYVAHIRYNMPEKDILEKLRKFKILSNVVSTNHNTVVEKALNSTFKDFEDALQYYSAETAGCDIIITRNKKDFKQAALPVMTAEEFLKTV